MADAWSLLRRVLTMVVIGSSAVGLAVLVPAAQRVVYGVFMANAVVWALLGPVLYLCAAFPRLRPVPADRP